MDVDVKPLLFAELQDYVERTFRKSRPARAWTSASRSTPSCRRTIETDPKRLQQVLKNLLSNALEVHRHRARSTLTIEVAAARAGAPTSARLNTRRCGDRLPGDRHRHRHPGRQAPHHLRGVPAGRRHHQPQVRRHRPRPVDQPRDRAAARRRDPARPARSARAARFTLYLPSVYTPTELNPPRPMYQRSEVAARVAAERAVHRIDESLIAESDVEDDRDAIGDGDRVLLIVEDDLSFASILLDLAREKGFKGLAATRGDVGLALARQLPAGRDHPRHRPAGHGRLDGARSAQARPGDAAHPGAHHLADSTRRTAACGSGRWRTWQAGRRARRWSRRFTIDRRLHRPQGQEPAGRRGRRRRAPEHRRADRQRRREDHGGRDRRGGARGARRADRSTAWCSTSGCPT